MAAGGIRGLPLAYVVVGGVLLWSGVQNTSVSDVLRAVSRGQTPAPGPTTESAGGGSGGSAGAVNTAAPTTASVAAYQAYARVALAAHGWPDQYQALANIVAAESNWNPKAQNASGAFGIAQALGHGQGSATQGTLANEYGNYGTTDAICKAANSGNGEAQIEWMLNYIGEAYGSPNAAWAYHEANGAY